MAKTGVRRPVRGLARVTAEDLNRELARRQRVAARLERKRAQLLGRVADLERQIRATGGNTNGHVGRGGGTRARNETTLAGALTKILKGKTMSVTDAAAAVQKAGYRTHSNNFRVQVNIALIKGGFKRMGRGLYTAK